MMPLSTRAAAQAILADLSEARVAMAHSVLETIAETRTVAGDAFGHVLGIVVEQAQADESRVSLEIKPHMLNPHGIAQGGVTYALADYAGGVAVFARLGSPNMVTQDMHLRYHGPARIGRITARAHVTYQGTRTITTYCSVHQNDTLIASATATFAILNPQEVAALT